MWFWVNVGIFHDGVSLYLIRFVLIRKSLNPVSVDVMNLSIKPFLESDTNLGYKTNINLIDNCKAYTDTINKVFGRGWVIISDKF